MTIWRGSKQRQPRGFTMTELLVVIAITSILMGLLFIPIIQGFNVTRRARAESEAQTAARTGLERITREIRSAAYVFDNTGAPVAIPLNRTVNMAPGGTPTNLPLIMFAKIDIVPSGTQGLAPGDVLDPTTGQGLDGSMVRLPLAPGTRVVRYFLGLQRNLTPAGAMETYSNPYEFGLSPFDPKDVSHNPILLYRAEYDPADPNLIDPSQFNNPASGAGGFNDPLFFYNTNVAPNGNSFAANWKRIASPVVQGPTMDMVVWRKDSSGDLVADAPMRTLVRFVPGTVVGDTAVPGHLQAAAAEAPSAVPTMYTSKDGQWVLPFTVTIFRGASGAGASRPTYGTLQVRFDREVLANGQTRVRATPTASEGSLQTDLNEFYVVNEPASGRLFVKSPNLTFAVDSSRGRIETAFPALAANDSGAPLCMVAGSLVAAAPGVTPTNGDLLPIVLRLNTRDPQAGVGTVPTNQGRVAVFPLGLGTGIGYVSDTANAIAGDIPSPMRTFGNGNLGSLGSGGGLMIVPGSEQVSAPDLAAVTSSISTLVSWHRAPSATGSVVKKATLVDDPLDGTAPARRRWTAATGARTFLLEQDTQPNDGIRFQFDEEGGPGLPSKSVTDSGNVAERILEIRYLWQNNYARKVGGAQNGWPVNTDDQSLVDLAGGSQSGRQSVVPDPDVVKVDYATRSQIVVDFGVGVYDTNTRRARTLQVSDRVRVGNLNR
jgi:prepilin-type N-terminal cleavage/methylation domain-containing protein